ncbi:helix-turn-helix transcriptional regulator [Photobacterium damselae]|uniref:helix-turn-helix transcriptional regulator n=1 Tax=Photobacterium damselae TaxID=38293 RepID=UPI0030F37F9E
MASSVDKSQSFSSCLKALRLQSEISQVDMAKKLDVARQTYLDLERGKTEPRYSVLLKLSLIFNVPINTFFAHSQELLVEYIPLKKATNIQLMSELQSRLGGIERESR